VELVQKFIVNQFADNTDDSALPNSLCHPAGTNRKLKRLRLRFFLTLQIIDQCLFRDIFVSTILQSTIGL